MGYVEERKNLTKISEYLDQMKIPYKFSDIGDKDKENEEGKGWV